MKNYSKDIFVDSKELEDYYRLLAEVFDLNDLFGIAKADFTEKSGIRIHLDILEVDKNAPTIVFIPGTGTYSLCYSPFYNYLFKSGYNIIGFDPRGHGRSDGEKGDYTLGEILLDTEAAITYAIENFNPEVSLMGCSQGGILAFYMAARESRLKSVICQNFADLTGRDSHKLSRYPKATKFLKPFLLPILDNFPDNKVSVESYINLKQIPLKHFGNLHNFLEQDPLALKSIKLKAVRSLTTTGLDKHVHEITTPIFA